ncbi:hypothetical protein AK812_SmicGene31403 [Symbiodinium microadriaticum]|uniref:Uncharacterized protein n=1 Tax=Symbiodinium microadriaticum TaxID=2951 RepID=A0A1Q9CWR7_SYMMI|nr:hypothetical protein AK812_SmicGene31403 [Symbiodinium microadriaticum]
MSASSDWQIGPSILEEGLGRSSREVGLSIASEVWPSLWSLRLHGSSRGIELRASSCLSSPSQDSDFDATPVREAGDGHWSWYPEDSMELAAVLAQEPGMSGCDEADECFHGAGKIQAQGTEKGGPRLMSPIMRLDVFLDEAVPDFPFAQAAKAPSV